jgi:glyoxylase-like metal-dependent hydrolase (beta-lactamase superfamily II)
MVTQQIRILNGGASMRVANGIVMLELEANVFGQRIIIHPTVIHDDKTAMLVDAGFPGQTAELHTAMQRAGVDPHRLRKVLITHQDLDHIGGLPHLLLQSSFPITVLASELEKPFIQGERPLLKYTAEVIESVAQSMPAELADNVRRSLQSVRDNPPKARVDQTVVDGDVLSDFGGIVVIETPGHTPGHVSLYHKPSRTLIAGDAMRVEFGELLGPDPKATLDMETAAASLVKFKHFDIQAVICYHGGLIRHQVNHRIAELCGYLGGGPFA